MPSDPRAPLPQEEAPRCPDCKRALQEVRYPGGYLNEDQWSSIRAGDWFCEDCPARPGQHYRYFWRRDFPAPSPSGAGAPPDDDATLDSPNWAQEDRAALAARGFKRINDPRGASSGGAPAGEPTPDVKAIHAAVNYILDGVDFSAAAGAVPLLKSLAARLSGSVSPPPSGEERPALTREEWADEIANVRKFLPPLGESRSFTSGTLRDAHDFLDSLAVWSSSSVPSETGETARLRAALEQARPGAWEHHPNCRSPGASCTCGLAAFRKARRAALSPTEEEPR
jgi:hypothetical protein